MPALSDPVESVRDAAFRALQTSVAHYAKTHPGYVLPHLEGAIFETDWRVRLASIQLLGQLIDESRR